MKEVNECRNYALRKTKFEVVEVVNQDIPKNSEEKFIPFFKNINGQVAKYTSVCIGPNIKDKKLPPRSMKRRMF